MAAMGFAQLRLDVAMRVLAVHWARAPTKTCTILTPKEQDCLTMSYNPYWELYITRVTKGQKLPETWSKSWLNRSRVNHYNSSCPKIAC